MLKEIISGEIIRLTQGRREPQKGSEQRESMVIFMLLTDICH